MEQKKIPPIRKASADDLAKGREYWETNYKQFLGMQEEFIDRYLKMCGLPINEVSRDMAANYHLQICSEYRQWIDETFLNQ